MCIERKHWIGLGVIAIIIIGAVALSAFEEFRYSFLDNTRALYQTLESFDFMTKFIVFIFSAAIFLVSYLAFMRTESNKFLLVTIAFFIFALKLAIQLVDVFYSPGQFFTAPMENIFDLLMLVFLFFAIFKKK